MFFSRKKNNLLVPRKKPEKFFQFQCFIFLNFSYKTNKLIFRFFLNFVFWLLVVFILLCNYNYWQLILKNHFHSNINRVKITLKNDCGDNSDENQNCPALPFKCPSSQVRCGSLDVCINQTQLCDNIEHCPGGSDEGAFCSRDDCTLQNGGCSHFCHM